MLRLKFVVAGSLGVLGTGMPGSPAGAQSLEGVLAADRYGEAVAWAGDVNADGRADFLVGAPFANGTHGRAGVVYVYLGIPGGIPGAPSQVLEGEVNGDEFGAAISAAGDLNQDGAADYLVGAPANDGAGFQAGRVYLFLGGSSLPATPARSWDGDLPGARFGSSLAGPFDFNDDGRPDFAAAAPEYGGGATRRGQVKLYLGATTVGGIVQPSAYVFTGDQANWNLGFSLDPAGDFDRDGYADLVAGAPQRFDLNPGRAVIWFGQAGSVTPPSRLVLTGEGGADRFGWSVSGSGDRDQDLADDLVVGAPGRDSLGVDKGAVYLFRGGLTVDALSDGVTFGSVAGDSLGCAVDGGFDWSGDGLPDVAAGAPGADASGSGSGEVRLFLGGGTASIAAPDTVLYPSAPIVGFEAQDRFGAAVRFASSIDGDPLADLIVGAPAGNTSSGATAGYVNVVRGTPTTTPVRILAFGVALTEEGARIQWDLADEDALAAVRLSVVRSGVEAPLHEGWLAAGIRSWFDPDRSLDLRTYRLWGLDRTGSTTLLAEAPWSGQRSFPVALRAGPNPFEERLDLALDLPAGPGEISIFDAAGREVRRLLARESTGETLRLSWDGRDARGDRLPAGVYLVSVRTAAGTVTRPVVRLR